MFNSQSSQPIIIFNNNKIKILLVASCFYILSACWVCRIMMTALIARGSLQIIFTRRYMITSRGNWLVTSKIWPGVYSYTRMLKLLSALFPFHIFQLPTRFCYSKRYSRNSKILEKKKHRLITDVYRNVTHFYARKNRSAIFSINFVFIFQKNLWIRI